jgi:transcriptional regulator with XRE-family HTH domain
MSIGSTFVHKAEKGIRQRKLSVLCGVSNSEISRIEAGRVRPFSRRAQGYCLWAWRAL